MEYHLVRLYPAVASAAEARRLPELPQQQLLRALKAYHGPKTTLASAFRGGECAADGFRVEDAAHPGTGLYDYWEVNADSGSVFVHETLTSAGVEMIQFSFDVCAGYPDADGAADLLAQALQHAARVPNPADPYVFEYDERNREVLADFNRPDAAPTTRKEWDQLLNAHHVTEGFVRKYEAHFGPKMWWKIYGYTRLSEDYLRTHAAHLDWERICIGQKLSEAFIREFEARVDWEMVSTFQPLSEDFIREFQARVDWVKIANTQRLSDAFVAEFAARLNPTQLDIRQRSEAFVRQHQAVLDWNRISQDVHLSEAFIREFAGKLNWALVSVGQQLSTPFIEEFADRITWSNLSHNPHLTDEQMRHFKDRLSWGHLIYFGRRISEEMIREHEALIPDRMGWETVVSRKMVGPEYLKEISSRLRAAKKKA